MNEPRSELAGIDADLGQGRTEEAERRLLRLHERTPGRPQVLARLVRVALAQRQWLVLRERAEALAEMAPDHPLVLLGRGEAALGLGVPELAAACFTSLTRSHPDRAEGWAGWARAAEATAGRDGTIAVWRKALAHNPGQHRFRLALAREWSRRGRPLAVLDLLEGFTADQLGAGGRGLALMARAHLARLGRADHTALQGDPTLPQPSARIGRYLLGLHGREISGDEFLVDAQACFRSAGDHGLAGLAAFALVEGRWRDGESLARQVGDQEGGDGVATRIGCLACLGRLEEAAAIEEGALAERRSSRSWITYVARDLVPRLDADAWRWVRDGWPATAFSPLRCAGPGADQPPWEGAPPHRYIIAALPRSGSGLLCRHLTRLGLGVPAEYANVYHQALLARHWHPEDGPGYWRRLMAARTSPSGWFGVKVMFDHLRSQRAWLAEQVLVPGTRAILLYRRDLIGQAISRHVSQATGVWYEGGGQVTPATEDVAWRTDLDHVERLIQEMLVAYRDWYDVLVRSRMEVMELAYEDLVADQPGVMAQVVGFLGAPAGAVAAEPKGPAWEVEARAGLRAAFADRHAPPSAPPVDVDDEGRRPVVHYYAPCWNDGEMLAHMFRHYEGVVDRYFLRDDGSTDGTRDLLAGRTDVVLDATGFPHRSLLHEIQEFDNEFWKRSRGVADWVIIANIDEFLWHPDLMGHLRWCTRMGYSLLPSRGYHMVGAGFPVDDRRLCEVIRRGLPAPNFNKTMIFDPDLIEEINYGIGRHDCAPIGTIRTPAWPTLRLLHYKDVAADWTAQRQHDLGRRMGERSGTERTGWHWNVAGQAHAFRHRHLEGAAIEVV